MVKTNSFIRNNEASMVEFLEKIAVNIISQQLDLKLLIFPLFLKINQVSS